MYQINSSSSSCLPTSISSDARTFLFAKYFSTDMFPFLVPLRAEQRCWALAFDGDVVRELMVFHTSVEVSSSRT
jgi:hypothetical protein